MLKLNGIPENRALDSQEFTRGLLENVLSEPASKDVLVRQSFHERAGELSLKLGLLSYALEADAGEVRKLLRDAARHLAPALTLRAAPDPNTSRSPWEAEKFINVIVCFGDAAAVKSLAQLKTPQYRNPVQPEHDALARYLSVLLKRLGGAKIDTKTDAGQLAKVAQACEAPTATKDERLFLLPAAGGLAAVATADADQWNYAIAQLLSAHGREARRGDLKLLTYGFVSFRALMLAKLGIDSGMECRAGSNYLPLFLLEDIRPEKKEPE